MKFFVKWVSITEFATKARSSLKFVGSQLGKQGLVLNIKGIASWRVADPEVVLYPICDLRRLRCRSVACTPVEAEPGNTFRHYHAPFWLAKRHFNQPCAIFASPVCINTELVDQAWHSSRTHLICVRTSIETRVRTKFFFTEQPWYQQTQWTPTITWTSRLF